MSHGDVAGEGPEPSTDAADPTVCGLGGPADAGGVPPQAADLLGVMLASLEQSPAMVTITWGPDHQLAYQNFESVRVLVRRKIGLPVAQTFADFPD